MKANDIADIILNEEFPKGKKIGVTGFTGCGLGESDVLMISRTMMVYEYEIKCSYSDFKADFKKIHKHHILSNKDNSRDKLVEKYLPQGWFPGPNYFYYVCRENLIPIVEVPGYAGLIYVINNQLVIQKKAPKLHKNQATTRLIMSIVQNLTAKMIYGCSYMNYKRKINEKNTTT